MDATQRGIGELQGKPQQAGIGIAHIGIAAGLALCAVLANYFPQVVIFLAVAGFAAWGAWTAAEKKREAREAAARATSYALICGPCVIPSAHPNEPAESVRERAAEFREQLRISGNPYWAQIPVEAYPYNPMIFGVGQLSAAWNIYLRYAAERQHAANQEWLSVCPEQLRALFLSQVMPQPAAQTETAL